MKKINIVGAGPAGAYFALLMRSAYPKAEITIWEAYAQAESHGWGIVLTQGVHEVLRKHDRETHEAISAISNSWRDLKIFQHGRPQAISGFPYISVSRVDLIRILREACLKRNVSIHFETRVDEIESLRDCDVFVGADGANSFVRKQLESEFEPMRDVRNNRYIWLGTNQVYDAFTMMFRRDGGCVFAAEAYSFSKTASTFIAQCTNETWLDSGLAEMSVEQSCDRIGEIFSQELDGKPVVANASSAWRQFPVISNNNWVADNTILLGDALHTAHFSTGSGTRLALEDAIAAASALAGSATTEDGLQYFARHRKPAIDRFQATAMQSLQWYERIDEVVDLEPEAFAFSALTRSKAVDLRVIRIQDREFANRYVAWRDRQPETA